MDYEELESKVSYLEHENAKLLEEFDKMDVWYSKELLYAISENDKLRELVKDIWTSCPVNAEDCSTCKHKEGKTVDGCALYDRMRKLGIEVEE